MNLKFIFMASLLVLSSGSIASDNNWISPNLNHTFHEGTVNESWNRYIKDVDGKMDQVKAGFASASAMNNVPLGFSKTISLGLGVGGYKSGSAVAVAFGAHPENTNVTLKMSGAFDNKSNSTLGAGFAYSW